MKKDYIINKELSGLAGFLALKCGRLLAVANAAMITTKHMSLGNFEAPPVAPAAEPSSPKAEQHPAIAEQQPADP